MSSKLIEQDSPDPLRVDRRCDTPGRRAVRCSPSTASKAPLRSSRTASGHPRCLTHAANRASFGSEQFVRRRESRDNHRLRAIPAPRRRRDTWWVLICNIRGWLERRWRRCRRLRRIYNKELLRVCFDEIDSNYLTLHVHSEPATRCRTRTFVPRECLDTAWEVLRMNNKSIFDIIPKRPHNSLMSIRNLVSSTISVIFSLSFVPELCPAMLSFAKVAVGIWLLLAGFILALICLVLS